MLLSLSLLENIVSIVAESAILRINKIDKLIFGGIRMKQIQLTLYVLDERISSV